MSNEWGYNIKEYQLIISEISNRKRLVVEGKTDKLFFKILLDEFFRLSNNPVEIDIDDIETFINQEENNNLKRN